MQAGRAEGPRGGAVVLRTPGPGSLKQTQARYETMMHARTYTDTCTRASKTSTGQVCSQTREGLLYYSLARLLPALVGAEEKRNNMIN